MTFAGFVILIVSWCAGGPGGLNTGQASICQKLALGKWPAGNGKGCSLVLINVFY